MGIRTQTDKRFKRARVKTPRRQRSWRALALLLARGAVVFALLLYGAHRAKAMVMNASSLRITQIAVDGTRHLSDEHVVGLLRGLRLQHILTVDLDASRGRLLRSPWIREAALRRHLPATIHVAIIERDPLGIARVGDRLYLVADDGVVLDQYGSEYAAYDLPLIDGLYAGPARGGLLLDDVRVSLANEVIGHLRQSPALARRVSQIDVSDEQDAVVLLTDDTARLHLGREQFVERLKSYVDLAPRLRARVEGIDYVDLRFDSRVFVKPARSR
jgi:cell division protein FtsQ